MDSRPLPIDVDILSDDDDDDGASSPSPFRPNKQPPPTVFVIDDDPTPQKPNRALTPSFVAETPFLLDRGFDSDASIVKCSLARSNPEKFSGISGLICLESDNESDDCSYSGRMKKLGAVPLKFGLAESSETCSTPSRPESEMGMSSDMHYSELHCSAEHAAPSSNDKNHKRTDNIKHGSFDGCSGTTTFMRIVGDNVSHGDLSSEDAGPQLRICGKEDYDILKQADNPVKRKRKNVPVDADKSKHKIEEASRKKQQKEEKNRLNEERKQKRQQEKLEKAALKAEAAEKKKLEKEKTKWENGKFAIKSIVAEIDAKVVENGSVGGHLLTRLAEKGLSFRITSNPVERSILWKMCVPDQIAQVSSVGAEVPYVLLVYQAEDFCKIVAKESLEDDIRRIRGCHPSFTICYLTNKLMSFINKSEQNQYKNPSSASWRRPQVEEALSKLTTHFTRVHSRQCIDEAELAEHVVGLTSSLANCQFRKKLTWLSVNANGSIIPNNFIDRKLIKKSIWLKALISIPKVQPRHAIAIGKTYPTMRSLLNVYMDPNKSVHEKEFLLKDLMMEGLLGNEDRRLGEVCSKRVYRILMAQRGGIITDDVEHGADLFRG